MSAKMGRMRRKGDAIVVVVDRQVREGGLREGLCDQLALLVLEVRVVASRLLLREGSSLCQPLLIPTLDDLSNTLRNSVQNLFKRE